MSFVVIIKSNGYKQNTHLSDKVKEMNKLKILLPIGLALILGSIFLYSYCLKKAPEQNTAAGHGDQATSDVKKLTGRWKRLDGAYVIDIARTAKNGILDAAYFNPKPINVTRSLFMIKDGQIKIFIELNDEGYPGSEYTLTYYPDEDILKGKYFHGGLKKYFEVMFIRIKNEK